MPLNKLKLVALLILLTSLAIYGIRSESAAQTVLTVKVIALKDGDSFDALDKNQEKIRVRLYGIDCPEYGQDFSQQAKKFSSERIFKKNITLNIIDEDRYGRFVADVILADQSKLNDLLVANGLCRWYQQYAADNLVLKNLEQQAQQHGLGIWSLKNQIAPWDFRTSEHERRLAKKHTRAE